jgi:hypothetical protein
LFGTSWILDSGRTRRGRVFIWDVMSFSCVESGVKEEGSALEQTKALFIPLSIKLLLVLRRERRCGMIAAKRKSKVLAGELKEGYLFLNILHTHVGIVQKQEH